MLPKKFVGSEGLLMLVKAFGLLHDGIDETEVRHKH